DAGAVPVRPQHGARAVRVGGHRRLPGRDLRARAAARRDPQGGGRRHAGGRVSVAPRLARLLAADGKCFDVAIDHGVFNEPSFLPGIEDMPAAVRTIVAANPDAIQLTPGQATLLQQVPGKGKPALVLRVDVANVYGPNPPDELFCSLMDGGVEAAVRL